jgi:hypothetical protein
MVSVTMPAKWSEVPEGPTSAGGLGQAAACRGEDILGPLGVIDGPRQHHGAVSGKHGHFHTNVDFEKMR